MHCAVNMTLLKQTAKLSDCSNQTLTTRRWPATPFTVRPAGLSVLIPRQAHFPGGTTLRRDTGANRVRGRALITDVDAIDELQEVVDWGRG